MEQVSCTFAFFIGLLHHPDHPAVVGRVGDGFGCPQGNSLEVDIFEQVSCTLAFFLVTKSSFEVLEDDILEWVYDTFTFFRVLKGTFLHHPDHPAVVGRVGEGCGCPQGASLEGDIMERVSCTLAFFLVTKSSFEELEDDILELVSLRVPI